jgi:hypothetical protein
MFIKSEFLNNGFSDTDYFLFSFNYFLLRENYITLIIKKTISSLKDILIYKKSKCLIYIKLK